MVTSALDPGSVLFKVMAVLHSFAADDRAVPLAELAAAPVWPRG